MAEAEVDVEELRETVRSLVAAERSIPIDDVALDTPLEELGFDSLDASNVSFEIEEKFDIEIPDDVLEGLVTVGDIVDGVQALLRTKVE